MSLDKYKKKRDFTDTPEPAIEKDKKPDAIKSPGSLVFVIQKHYASHLHYDLRLELDGVLKSWAIPKGPTLDPKEKRLSVMVEDHPFEYRKFEGIIPEGNYGAGKVSVWDSGTYHAYGTDDREESSRSIRDGLQKGHITFILEGQKLKGEFALVRLKKASEKDWLMIKKNDEFASDTLEITDEETQENVTGEKTGKKKTGLRPSPVKPMLAASAVKPFDSKDWIFEIKWDGYRAIAEIKKNRAYLFSRNGVQLNERFPQIADSLLKIPADTILDGEIVAVDESGRSDFQGLQDYLRTGAGKIVFYVFDILSLEGKDQMRKKLIERKKILKKMVSVLGHADIRFSDFIEEKGIDFFEVSRQHTLEGIMAKKKNSIYVPGARSADWLKIKTGMRQEVVVAGFTLARGQKQKIGSLITGVYADDRLIFTGQVGTGFSQQEAAAIYNRLDKIKTPNSPFVHIPKTTSAPVWVAPLTVAEVRFSEWTRDMVMRQPVYLGMRDDKNAKDIIIEKVSKEKKLDNGPAKHPEKKNENTRFPGIRVELKHPKKIFWPDEGYTKNDLFQYYIKIAPYILPYIKDRLQSMNRCPDGITGECFYQKDLDYRLPEGQVTKRIYSGSKKDYTDYFVCSDINSLLYMVDLGCIDIHPWSSRVTKLENPDFAILDLDPLDASFKDVVKVAKEVKNVIDELEIRGYCKTSGSKGIHIYFPLAARYSYEQSLYFIKLIAEIVRTRLPVLTSTERDPGKRHKKVYLDCYQNRIGQTVASAYCIRPKKGAPVSTPLLWEELETQFEPGDFNIKNILKRLEKLGDIWKGVTGKGIDMVKCIKRIEQTKRV